MLLTDAALDEPVSGLWDVLDERLAAVAGAGARPTSVRVKKADGTTLQLPKRGSPRVGASLRECGVGAIEITVVARY